MIFGYVRVSTSTQSAESQKSIIVRYLVEHRWTLDEWIEVEMSSRRTAGQRRLPELLAKVAAGDTVSVFISQGALTHLQLHAALVTAVQGTTSLTAAPGTSSTAAAATTGTGVTPAASTSTLPTSSLMVTLALAPPDAERLVWGVEHGTLWLAKEKVGTPDGGTKVLDGPKVYQ